MTYIIGNGYDHDDAIDHAVETLRGRSTGTLGHWRSLGNAVGIVPLRRPSQAVGRIVTAQASAFDAAAVHYAVSLLQPGEVLVVGASGEQVRAPWGGGTSYAAFHASAAGVIIDAPVTDWDEIVHMGVPTWSRGTSSVTYRSAPESIPAEGGVNVPIQIGGAVVRPGDVAFADSDGVVFIPAENVVADAAELVERSRRERLTTWRPLAAGTALYDIKDSRSSFESRAQQS